MKKSLKVTGLVLCVVVLSSTASGANKNDMTCTGEFYKTAAMYPYKQLRAKIQITTCSTCGVVSAEVDWDEGGGFGESQTFTADGTAQWVYWDPHEYASTGLYHPKLSADDEFGNSCYLEFTKYVDGDVPEAMQSR